MITLRKRFSRFYRKKVYWYFHQVVKWGEKNGLTRNASETSKEYMDKIIGKIENMDVSGYDKAVLVSGLRSLSEDYQAAYYGSEEGDSEYEDMIGKLKEMNIKKKTRTVPNRGQ